MPMSNGKPQPSYFEQQRELLLGEISTNLESVLQNINNLNRSLEGIIAVGNEFSQVEGLWSQFENVMAKPAAPSNATAAAATATATTASPNGTSSSSQLPQQQSSK